MSNEQQNVSLGEVHRICLDIKTAVKEQNGRVTALEKDAIRIKTLWTGAVLAAAALWPYLKDKLGL